jgi:hypothetical protein
MVQVIKGTLYTSTEDSMMKYDPIKISIIKALTNPDCANEIKNNPSDQTLAILFKYTRGTSAGDSMVKLKYDPIKNSVTRKDPDTGKDVTKSLKKYRNEYILETIKILHTLIYEY